MNRFWIFLSLVFLGIAAAMPAVAQCVPDMSVTDVLVAQRGGTLPTAGDRTEHIRITQALANRLCITNFNANGNNSPQIRVEVTTDPTTSTPTGRSVGVFTVNAIDAGAGTALRVEVWGRANASDMSNGLMKLFPSFNATNHDLGTARVTVHRFAPSRTSEVNFHIAGRLNPVETEHYEEPAGNPGLFEEFVELGDDHEVAVLIPHGDGIEPELSDRIWRLDLNLEMYTNRQNDIWEGSGSWGSGQTARRWHITAADLSPVSFPGLALLTNQAAASPYRYAVAVHGFGDTGKGIIIGGQANKEEKCYIVQGIRDRLLTRRDEVAITIYYEEAGLVRAIEIPDSTGRTYPRTTFQHLRGMEGDNIVNRLSPNAGQVAGRGAFQFEISKGLRDDVTVDGTSERHELIDATMSAIGKKVGNLYGYHLDAVGACEPFE
jgi:phage replication-related protein YjqB (UPF0714/DUF867 family)